MTATAPVVHFTSMEVHVGREQTSESWHTCWSISAFLVWSTFHQRHNFLFWKICYIIHRYSFSRSWRFQIDRSRCINISLVCFSFTACWTIDQSKGYFETVLILENNEMMIWWEITWWLIFEEILIKQQKIGEFRKVSRILTRHWRSAWPCPNQVVLDCTPRSAASNQL